MHFISDTFIVLLHFLHSPYKEYNYFIKEVFFTIYERILVERDRLSNQISHLKTQLKNFPEGKLTSSRSGNHLKWYQSDGHHNTYIPKEKQQLIKQLATKKYLSLLLEDLSVEKRALDFYLRHHHTDIPKAEKLLLDTPEYLDLLLPHFTPHNKILVDWASEPYTQNPAYPEQLIHKCTSGHFVRSKSEALIDTHLHTHKIPYRYECILQLGDSTLYPDFTIKHPATGETYYWEHFGMMDNTKYVQNACSKLQLYTTHGIIPSIHLITTYETKDHPLSSETIEKIIEYYFQ